MRGLSVQTFRKHMKHVLIILTLVIFIILLEMKIPVAAAEMRYGGNIVMEDILSVTAGNNIALT